MGSILLPININDPFFPLSKTVILWRLSGCFYLFWAGGTGLGFLAVLCENHNDIERKTTCLRL